MMVKGGIRGVFYLLCLSLISGCPNAPLAVDKTSLIDGPWTLVSFGAPWCEVCRKLEPELAKFRREQPNVHTKYVDVEAKDSPPYRTHFPRYFHGRAIPLTVLVDPQGRARKDWTGYLSYPDLVAEIREIETNKTKEANR